MLRQQHILSTNEWMSLRNSPMFCGRKCMAPMVWGFRGIWTSNLMINALPFEIWTIKTRCFLHGSHRPWKVLEFESCLEQCLIFQSALNMGNFPWKVLENEFMVLKNIGTRKSNLLVLFCTFELRKVARFSHFVIKSLSLLIQWAVFFTVQITKSIFFV